MQAIGREEPDRFSRARDRASRVLQYGSSVLHKVSENVAYCYARASECRAKAADALNQAARQEYLDMDHRWLYLARSYELTDRIVDFTNIASSRAVRRTVLPDNFPGRDLQHAGTYGQAIRRGSLDDERSYKSGLCASIQEQKKSECDPTGHPAALGIVAVFA